MLLGCFLIVLAYTILYAKNWAWHGSPWCWGPRYLVPIVPLLMLGFPRLTAWPARYRSVALSLIVISGVIQLFALSIDYRRSLIQLHTTEPEAFENGDVLFSPLYSPLLLQPLAVLAVLHSPGANLQPFVADGPWLNHARPASQNIMLEQSVDLNSVNVWWVRMRHLPVSDSIKRTTNAFMLVWILCLGLVCGRMVCLLR